MPNFATNPKSSTLPVELRAQFLLIVGPVGLEPTTPRLVPPVGLEPTMLDFSKSD